MVEWNGMLISWMALMGSHLLIMTTFEQRPPLNKDHPNLIVGHGLQVGLSMSTTSKKRLPSYKDHFILMLKNV